MDDNPNQPQAGGTPPVIDPAKPNKSGAPVLGLVLGFLPSVMLLACIPFLNHSQPPAGLLFLCCAVSVICCFTASFMLFRSGRSMAIVGGLILLILNGIISFLFGCGAILTGATF